MGQRVVVAASRGDRDRAARDHDHHGSAADAVRRAPTPAQVDAAGHDGGKRLVAVWRRRRVIEIAEAGCRIEISAAEVVSHLASTSFNAASPRLEWVLTDPTEHPIRSAVCASERSPR
jgi:hypothetical protein